MKGWKRESRRHSMAAKGIKTSGIKQITGSTIRFSYPLSRATINELKQLKKEQDNITTSDLQGVVMALATKEAARHGIFYHGGQENRFKIMNLSDEMLEYIYEYEW